MKGVFVLFAFLLQIASSMLYLALHIATPNSFPPPLTAKEEAELISKMQEGDHNAKTDCFPDC